MRDERKRIIALAKKRGIKFHHGDPKKAKPLSEICGKIKSKHPYSTEELMPWRGGGESKRSIAEICGFKCSLCIKFPCFAHVDFASRKVKGCTNFSKVSLGEIVIKIDRDLKALNKAVRRAERMRLGKINRR